MPNWNNAPPLDSQRSGFRLIRTPTTNALIGHVITTELLGCRTHYVGNRTIPCEAPNCDPCNSGIGWRWHGYIMLVVDATQEIVIFEMTAITSAALVDYHKRYGTLRGAHIKAQRLNGRANGRVIIQAKPADLARVTLPAEMDITKLLCHIWNIAPNQAETPPYKTRPPAVDLKVDRERPEIKEPGRKPSEEDRDFILDIARKRNGNGRHVVDGTGV